MNAHEYIDQIIKRINTLTVTGLANMETVVEVVKMLGTLKNAIVIKDEDESE